MTLTNEKLRLSAPWVTYVRQVKALFEKDPDIKIKYDEDELELSLYVTGQNKADAIAELLPVEKAFGNIVLKIKVIPANLISSTPSKLLNDAFAGNPVFDSAITIHPDGTSNPFTYLVFKNAVTQIWNDDLSDPNGIKSTLLQDLAPEVLNLPRGVYCCTEPGEDIVR